MRTLLRKIHQTLLPASECDQFTPYVWLTYLLIFFISLVAGKPSVEEIFYSVIGLTLFLFLYFHAYWTTNKKIWINIVGIAVIATFLTFVTPGSSVFYVYASAFCCRLGSPKKGVLGILLITIWIALLSWYFNYSAYFYIPAISFSWMIGGVNIYQFEMFKKRQEIILSQQEVRDLAKTAERERIARDLHDLIGHTFSVLTLKAELAGKLIDKDLDRAKHEIEEVEMISRNALKQVREVVTGFRASDLNAELAHAKYVLESNEIRFKYEFDNVELTESTNKELAIILKELVTNVLKHSKASQVIASITQSDQQAILQLSDNGKGFSESATQGYGLKGIKERIEKLSGSFSVESDQGVEFVISVPLESV